ncbi:MAG: GntR family transcriptional regulator [Nocardioidaceae bacterium]|nr:GntR family transcriptional regulator [Nocardioidaceae bacterium]
MTDALPNRTGQRLGHVVYETLKERLLEGRYDAGSRISIEELKGEFGVSKQPVMDALRRLATLGIVEIVPQSGCRVSQYSLLEVRDFFTLFGSFEGEIAAAAAQRRTDDQLDALDAAWSTIASLETTADTAVRAHGYRIRNREFHLAIHQMAHSRVMAELSARMWDLSDFFINTVGPAQPLADVVHERNYDHDVIREAIRNRNDQVAKAAMERHIVGTIELISTTNDQARGA